MADQLIQAAPQLHIRFDGRSIDVDLNEIDVGVVLARQPDTRGSRNVS